MLSARNSARLRHIRMPLFLLLVLAVFVLANNILFEPTARRYERAVRQLGELGLGSQPGGGGRLLPPRLYRYMAENSRPAAQVTQMGTSGALGSGLLQTVTRLMTDCDIEVTGADPGGVVQSARTAQVRVELKARARYPQIVAFLDELARSGKLIQVDRLNLLSDTPDVVEAQISLTQIVFKSTPGGK